MAALNIATFVLKPGGSFVAKMFRGKDVTLMYTQLRQFFPLVTIAKPASSRNSSMEAFIVCQNYTPPAGYVPSMVNPMLGAQYSEVAVSGDQTDGNGASGKVEAGAAFQAETDEILGTNRVIVPFVACSDLSGFDSDKSYSLDGAYVPHAPTQLPINPSYKAAIEFRRSKGGNMSNKAL